MIKVLVADDDRDILRLLQKLLSRWGYEVVVATTGQEACDILLSEDAPRLAVLDWDMPEITGPEICRRCREDSHAASSFLIILTGKENKADVVSALDAGADDYVVKPFDHSELRARLRVGVRVIQLQQSLSLRVSQLQESLDQINELKKLLPICAYCKKIRDDNDYWQQVDDYMMSHSSLKFSHGICPDCFEKLLEQTNL